MSACALTQELLRALLVGSALPGLSCCDAPRKPFSSAVRPRSPNRLQSSLRWRIPARTPGQQCRAPGPRAFRPAAGRSLRQSRRNRRTCSAPDASAGVGRCEFVERPRQLVERPGPRVALVADELQTIAASTACRRARCELPRQTMAAHVRSHAASDSGSFPLPDVAPAEMRRKSSASPCPRSINELLDCSAASQMNVRVGGSRELASTGFGRPEVDLRRLGRRLPVSCCSRSDHLARKNRQRERIRQKAEAAATPHARQRQPVRQRSDGSSSQRTPAATTNARLRCRF